MPRKPARGGRRPGAGPKIQELKLTVNEALLIVDALNGILVEPTLAEQLVWQEVEEAIVQDKLDAKWQVDGADLVRRLKKLEHEPALDLLQRIDQFWSSHYVSDGRKRVRAVGLVQPAEG